jgi:tetratricopeptide (TPR) repeat protein
MISKVVELPVKKQNFRPVHPAVKQLNDYAAKEMANHRQFATAIAATKRAIKISPTSRELWCNLGTYAWSIQELEEARAATERAINIDPNYFMPHGNMGLILGSLQEYEQAEKHFARALELSHDNVDIHWNHSLMLLSQGKYKEGFQEYEYRIKRRKNANVDAGPIPLSDPFRYPKFPFPRWQGEPLEGKSVYVASEQGIGDNIIFSRYLPWLAEQAEKVYFCCSLDMYNLLWEFRHLFTYIPERVPVPEADYCVFLASLPFYTGTTLETIPTDPGLIRQRIDAQMRIGPAELPQPSDPDAFKIGICWTGNPELDRNDERSIPFHHLLDLLTNPHVWCHSLQFGPAAADIYKHHADALVYDLNSQMTRGLAVTGTAILGMDLIITCCTSIAHIAAACNVPCWVLLCYDPYWFWQRQGDSSPWWPSIRLFRQAKSGDWQGVMKNVFSELDALILSRSKEKHQKPVMQIAT